jgi:hypothetical protein
MTIGRLERKNSEVIPLKMRPVHNKPFEVEADEDTVAMQSPV